MSLCCPSCGSNDFNGASCNDCDFSISDVPIFSPRLSDSSVKRPNFSKVLLPPSIPKEQSLHRIQTFDSSIISYFKNPTLKSLIEIEKDRPPSSSGVYGWYFDTPLYYVPTDGCTLVKTGWWPFRTMWWLLYIGQAKNLKDRIVNYHIKGEHYAEGTMSSLRLSLGCLLSDKFGMMLCFPPESFGNKEKEFQKWLETHARVAWIKTENLDAMELEAITQYVLPLNHKDNQHPLKEPLHKLKAKFSRIARSQDLQEKYFSDTYKDFIKECKSLGIKK